MINWGLVPIGSVLPFPFDSFGGSGESLTLTGFAVTDVECYKGTSMTQRSSDAGYALMDTDGIDIDGRTGIHGFSIDTGDDTDAGFYAAGAFFWVVVDAVTINSQTVRFVVGTFRLGPAESSAGVPKVDASLIEGSDATNQIRDAVVDDATRIDASALNTLSSHDPGEAIMGATDLGTGAGLTSLATQASVDTIDNFLDTEVAAILADTNELQTDWADGGRLDLILDARASQTSVDTIDDFLDTEIAALTTAVADLPTNAELATALGTADDAVLAAVATVDGNVDAIKAKTDSLTFTVAGVVDANISHVIADPVQTNGATDTNWGGAP